MLRLISLAHDIRIIVEIIVSSAILEIAPDSPAIRITKFGGKLEYFFPLISTIY